MKRLVLATAGLLALGAAAANAADLPRRAAPMPTKAPAYAPVYNWTGLYIGINGGGGWGRSTWSNPAVGSIGFNTSGGLIGGTLGYNWQVNQAVFGLETDLDWTNIKGSSASAVCGGAAVTCETKNSYLGTVRGRLGYAFDRWLPYITGGLAYGDIKANATGFGTNSTSRAGWTLGGGLEFAVAGPWTAKVEYLYADLGKASCSFCVAGTDVKFNANIIRGGVNYRF